MSRIVSHNEEPQVVDPVEALRESCSLLGDNAGGILDLGNETCPGGNASLCRPDTLCCGGECKGLPENKRIRQFLGPGSPIDVDLGGRRICMRGTE